MQTSSTRKGECRCLSESTSADGYITCQFLLVLIRYARLAKAYQAQGDLAQALDALAEGLRLKGLENEAGLVDMFVDMQTDGKGLPEDDEVFQKVAKTILEEDKESAKRVKDIGGLWRKRISRVAVL